MLKSSASICAALILAAPLFPPPRKHNATAVVTVAALTSVVAALGLVERRSLWWCSLGGFSGARMGGAGIAPRGYAYRGGYGGRYYGGGYGGGWGYYGGGLAVGAIPAAC